MNQLSEILKVALLKKGISQAQAAQDADIERKTFNSYVTGRTEPDLPTLKKIIRALGIEREITSYLLEQNVPDENDKLNDIDTNSPGYLAGKLSEKEERRKDLEKFYEDAKEEKKELYKALAETRATINGVLTTIVSNLTGIKEDTHVGLAYQKAWVEYIADSEAQGDQKKKDEVKARLGKLLRQKLGAGPKTDKKSDVNN